MPDDLDVTDGQANGPDEDDFQPVAEMARGFWSARVLHTAVTLDLFTSIGGQRLTASQLAGRLDADPRGVGLLANALVALGFLELDGDRYAATNVSRRYLDQASPDYRGHVVQLADWWWKHWTELPRAVRDGGPTPVPDPALEMASKFTLAMHEGKPQAGEMLAARVDLHGVRRIVDLGGGAGTFAEALARALPDAQVVLVDRREVLEVARRRLPEELLDERIVLYERDFLVDGIPLAGSRPGAYDLALLSSVLHLNGPQENQTLLSRVYDALEPGGRVVIREFLCDETGTAPPDVALFAVTMLVTTANGRCYSFAETKEWLNRAGFGEVEESEFDGPVKLITARRA